MPPRLNESNLDSDKYVVGQPNHLILCSYHLMLEVQVHTALGELGSGRVELYTQASTWKNVTESQKRNGTPSCVATYPSERPPLR